MLHSKQWYYSLHRDFQNCYSTRRSLTRFFKTPIPAPILHIHITLQSREFSIQNPILHTEDRELFEYYNSMHRRQGDLLEMHPCVLQDIQGNPSYSRDIQDIPVIHDLPAFQAILQCPSILQLECIFYIFYNFYSSIGFHRKLHRVPVGQLQTLQTFILQRKGDVAISVKMSRCQDDIFPRIELIPSFVLSSDNTNCKNDIQLFHQLFDELSVHTDYH